MRIGGVARDVPEGWTDRVNAFCDQFLPILDEILALLTRNKIFMDRTVEVGVITKADALAYGITGPNLRGSGVAAAMSGRRAPLSLVLGRSRSLLETGCAPWQGPVEVGVVAGNRARGVGGLFARMDGESDGTVIVVLSNLMLAPDLTEPATAISELISRAIPPQR